MGPERKEKSGSAAQTQESFREGFQSTLLICMPPLKRYCNLFSPWTIRAVPSAFRMWIYHNKYVSSCIQMLANAHKLSDWALPCPTKRRTLGPCQIEGGNPAGLLAGIPENGCHSLRRTIVQTILKKNRVRNQNKIGTWPLNIGFPHDPTFRPHIVGIHLTSLWRCYKIIKWFLCRDQLIWKYLLH